MKIFENGKWVYKSGGVVNGKILGLVDDKCRELSDPEKYSPLEKLKKLLIESK